MKGRKFEEADDLYEGEEIPDLAGFDLRNKSLTNTAKREAEPRKAVLPLKSIMKEILDKPVSENAQKVGFYNSQKSILFSKKKVILKNVEKGKKNAKLEAIKSHIKKKTQLQGKVLPNFSREREYERNLKMIAVEGSRSLFTSYQAFQCPTRSTEKQTRHHAR